MVTNKEQRSEQGGGRDKEEEEHSGNAFARVPQYFPAKPSSRSTRQKMTNLHRLNDSTGLEFAMDATDVTETSTSTSSIDSLFLTNRHNSKNDNKTDGEDEEHEDEEEKNDVDNDTKEFAKQSTPSSVQPITAPLQSTTLDSKEKIDGASSSSVSSSSRDNAETFRDEEKQSEGNHDDKKGTATTNSTADANYKEDEHGAALAIAFNETPLVNDSGGGESGSGMASAKISATTKNQNRRTLKDEPSLPLVNPQETEASLDDDRYYHYGRNYSQQQQRQPQQPQTIPHVVMDDESGVESDYQGTTTMSSSDDSSTREVFRNEEAVLLLSSPTDIQDVEQDNSDDDVKIAAFQEKKSKKKKKKRKKKDKKKSSSPSKEKHNQDNYDDDNDDNDNDDNDNRNVDTERPKKSKSKKRKRKKSSRFHENDDDFDDGLGVTSGLDHTYHHRRGQDPPGTRNDTDYDNLDRFRFLMGSGGVDDGTEEIRYEEDTSDVSSTSATVSDDASEFPSLRQKKSSTKRKSKKKRKKSSRSRRRKDKNEEPSTPERDTFQWEGNASTSSSLASPRSFASETPSEWDLAKERLHRAASSPHFKTPVYIPKRKRRRRSRQTSPPRPKTQKDRGRDGGGTPDSSLLLAAQAEGLRTLAQFMPPPPLTEHEEDTGDKDVDQDVADMMTESDREEGKRVEEYVWIYSSTIWTLTRKFPVRDPCKRRTKVAS